MLAALQVKYVPIKIPPLLIHIMRTKITKSIKIFQDTAHKFNVSNTCNPSFDIDAYAEKLGRFSRILIIERIDVKVIASSPSSPDGKVLESTAFRDKESLRALLAQLPSPLFKIMYEGAL